MAYDLSYTLMEEEDGYSVSGYSGNPSDVIIPDIYNGKPVVGISPFAFNNCDSLKSIVIPDSVKSIGYYAFQSCRYLTSVTLGEGVTSIGANAFLNCWGLININIPDSVVNIGDSVFTGCTNLKSKEKDGLNYLSNSNNPYIYLYSASSYSNTPKINDRCKFIGDYAFSSNTSLKSIIIPNGIISIGSYAFQNCHDLRSIVIPDNVMSVGNGAFLASGLTDAIIGNGVKVIPANMFLICNNLKNVKLGDKVTHIGSSAFQGCGSLKDFAIPDNTVSIGNSAFQYCGSLTEIVIPDSVTSIGEQAFSWCNVLAKISLLPKTPASLGNAAFDNMHSRAIFYCHSSAIDDYRGATNWNVYSSKFAIDDIRLGFAMSAKAQKKYFAKKEDLNILNLENGASEDSLQQRHSLAQGARSVAFGGAITSAKAEKSLAIGASYANSNASMAVNEHTTANGWASAAFGGQTKTNAPYQLALGYNNIGKEDTLLEVGNGEYGYSLVATRPSYGTAMSTLQYYSNMGELGYSRITPIKCPTIEDYNAIEEIYEFTGTPSNAFEISSNGDAKIQGNLTIGGNVTLVGDATTLDTETIMVKDNVITTNSSGIELVEPGGFAIKTDETNAYGIMYDPNGDGVKIGLGNFDGNGKFIYREGEAQFLATRADSIDNGNLLIWNNTKKTLIDSGKSPSSFVARDTTSSNIIYGKEGGVEKVYDVSQGITQNTIARRTDYGAIRCVTQYENDAATKGYVDGGFVAKQTDATTEKQAYIKAVDGSQAMIDVTGSVSSGAVVQRLLDGNIQVPTNVSNSNYAISKGQADSSYVAKMTGTPDEGATRGFIYGLDSDGTTAKLFPVQIQANTGTIPLRNPNSNFYVGTPTLEYECTNKGYVDGLIVELLARIEALEAKHAE